MSGFKIQFQLANKLLRDKDSHYARPIVNLSIAGVALGLIIMIAAIAVTSGYKKEIRDKVIGMGSHIRISNYDNNYSFEPVPFERNQFFIKELRENPDIKNLQYFSTKVGIIKTSNQVEGIVLKGIDTSFFWEDFEKNIIAGKKIILPDTQAGKDILISSTLSKKLNIKVGDKVRTYFVQDPPMQRSFTVSGIFETGLPEFDEKYALVDLRHVQKLNQWNSNMIGGIEILIYDYDKIDEIGESVNNSIGYKLKAETIKQIYPEIFEWIALFDTNVIVLLIITLFVCSITMMSTFFIVVLEQTRTIGILKAIGIKNRQIMNIFMLVASKILIKGLIIGDVIALIICLIQKYFHLIKLDAATYYVDYIPINLNSGLIIALNIGVFLICLAVISLPAYYVAKKISPVKAIRFD
jgi:lipoprotein-releasing system permease protein